MTLADSIANARHDSTKIRLVADAVHNLTMAETDESGGFHNHLYSVALLNDVIARAIAVTGIAEHQSDAHRPTKFALLQNYPNPFNPSTKIGYELPREAKVTLRLHNILGQIVMELVNAERTPGRYEVQLNARNLASGVYLYRLTAVSFEGTKEILLVR